VAEPLVIAGGRGWGNLGLERLVADLGLEQSVCWAGFASMEDQPLWYNAAALFVYPSLYEGFGLPVLEAMACGTPVLVSDRASLPEVVGDAGVLVDPDKIDALGDAMFSLLNDDDRRADLAVRGLERARTFTWDAAARATLATYRQTLGQT
jgi:glycosyltransferase involved in cell wall biosynthesis